MANRFRQFRLLLWKNFILQVSLRLNLLVPLQLQTQTNNRSIFVACINFVLTNSLLFIEDPPSYRNCFRTPVAGASGRSINSAKVSCITVTSLLRTICILILRNVFQREEIFINLYSLSKSKQSQFIHPLVKVKVKALCKLLENARITRSNPCNSIPVISGYLCGLC